MKSHTITSNVALSEALIAAGVLPANCRRYIIDGGEPGGPIKIFFECYGDERVLDAFTVAGITLKTPE